MEQRQRFANKLKSAINILSVFILFMISSRTLIPWAEVDSILL